jgi:hypothetical protein
MLLQFSPNISVYKYPLLPENHLDVTFGLIGFWVMLLPAAFYGTRLSKLH